MFYTIIQSAENDRWEGERFVCIEADDQDEANLRAEWFGIDFSLTIGRWESPKWVWHQPSCGVLEPGVNGIPIARCTARYGGHWIVVYKNGNLKSSLAVPLDLEPDRSINEPAEAT